VLVAHILCFLVKLTPHHHKLSPLLPFEDCLSLLHDRVRGDLHCPAEAATRPTISLYTFMIHRQYWAWGKWVILVVVVVVIFGGGGGGVWNHDGKNDKSTTTTTVQAWLPPYPHKNARHSTWESVQDMRRRLELSYDYTPAVIHPEMCRYLTEEECHYADASMAKQQEKTHLYPQLQTKQVGLNVNPKTGTIKALVLMVRFKDHVSRDMIPKSAVDDFWLNRVPQWMKVNSQGLYNLQATVIDWTTTDNTEKYYSFDKQGIVPEGQQMAWPILDNLDARPDW